MRTKVFGNKLPQCDGMTCRPLKETERQMISKFMATSKVAIVRAAGIDSTFKLRYSF